jgi:hypothetical protein
VWLSGIILHFRSVLVSLSQPRGHKATFVSLRNLSILRFDFLTAVLPSDIIVNISYPEVGGKIFLRKLVDELPYYTFN